MAPANEGGAVIIDVKGFGLVPGSNGLTIGSSSERAVYLSNTSDCRAIFFVDSDAQAATVLSALKSLHLEKSICEVKGKIP